MSSLTGTRSASIFEKVQELYDRNRFLQAWRESAQYWTPETSLAGLSTEELILGMRLAGRLGGSRLARLLAREAQARDPLHPRVRYFTCFLRRRGWSYFQDIRTLQETPELEGADPETQASWLGYSAVLWASIRDFARAHDCLARARAWQQKDSWVLSCESDVFAHEDKWAEALSSAEAAWEANPGTPYGARSLGSSLLTLGRVEEAARRLADAARAGESYEISQVACWYLCAWAESAPLQERSRILGEAQEIAATIATLAPLADRDTSASIARTHLDIAQLRDDHGAMEHWAEVARSGFHRRVLENLKKNPAGKRIRLPFRHAIQRHNECLPTSIGSAMAAMGTPIDADAMAAELTFGGTPEWAAADWLEQRGFVVRFFAASPELTAELLRHGFAPVLTLESDSNAHAVAVVGLDEAAGTVIVHDPSGYRETEYLIDYFGKGEAPLGPRAMVAVLPEHAETLDRLLPPEDAAAWAAREDYRRAGFLHGNFAARQVLASLAGRLPQHPVTLLLQALQDHEDGRIGPALAQLQALLARFPNSAFVRSNLIACCRSVRNTSLMRQTLADVVEAGKLPGVEQQQEWRYPPPEYLGEYADYLRLSAETRGRAAKLLHGLLARNPSYAPAWHNLADLFWDSRDFDRALLGYRISAFLADRNEHFARAYADALCRIDREQESFAWLRSRVQRFLASSHAVTTWVTLIDLLETRGHPEQALSAAQEALDAHPNSAELLVFLVPLYARMGLWSRGEKLLASLQETGHRASFHRAAASVARMQGELNQAIDHADAWVRETPLSMPARNQLVDLIALRDDAAAAQKLARAWLQEYPEHEEIEELYYRQLGRSGYATARRYRILLNRVKRNPEDSWAWCELSFLTIYDYQIGDAALQRRLRSRVLKFLAECDRTAPGEAFTIRAHAEWLEVQGEWSEAVERWLEAIKLDPANYYAYRHAWDCSVRLDAAQRLDVWKRMEEVALVQSGHSPVARDLILLAAQRFGVEFAEAAAARWLAARPDDPAVMEANVDVLLNHGHGRSDYERALQLLLPQLRRFPYALGLRLSHASALRKLGRQEEAEKVLHEIVRRHPDHAWSRVQLAWVNQRAGNTEEALKTLRTAQEKAPRDTSICDSEAQILIAEQRFAEARELVLRMTAKVPDDAGWRGTAIGLLLDCGSAEDAIQLARDAVARAPYGAYYWLLLGKTLADHPNLAEKGEVEFTLRKSLAFNPSLYESADYLAMLLVEQRRFDEAEAIITAVEKRLDDPSPARGRLAWIHRQRGEKRNPLEEMTAVVQHAPWYEWGWRMLMDWIAEDKAWDQARQVLTQLPAELRTNVSVRQKRLEVLDKAGFPSQDLDREWRNLLQDFPEEVALHLLRYDNLRERELWEEAGAVLRHIHSLAPHNPYLLARWIGLLLRDDKRDEALAGFEELMFAETEPSRWPVNHAWEAFKKTNDQEAAWKRVRARIEQGSCPTPQAMHIIADYAIALGGAEKTQKAAQAGWRVLFPDRGAREVLRLLKILDARSPDGRNPGRATLLSRLIDFGYGRRVLWYWRRHRHQIEQDVAAWCETGRAFANLKAYRAGRKFYSSWRDRKGVGMWVIANYLMCLTGLSKQQLREVRSSAHDALAGLPHDYCARYLVYRELEACALLGDQNGFLQSWQLYKEYVDGKLEEDEWFETRRRNLLADLPGLARSLRDNDLRTYKKQLRRLRLERLSLTQPQTASNSTPAKIPWWWIIWVVLWLLWAISNNFNSPPR